MKKIIVLVLAVAMSSAAYAQKSMWIVAGQSNASGMGDRRTSLKYTNPACFDYVETGDSLRILQDPTGENGKYFAKANSGSICPSFAWNLNKMTGDTVIIVSAARGGSACSTTGETIYGTWAEEGVLPLFDAAMTKCKAAIKLTGLPFSGVIWLQGERDANAINDGKMDGKDYEDALRNLIGRFRKNLGDDDLPFYIVLTGQYLNHPQDGYHQVRAAQRNVAKTVAGVHLVPVDPWLFPQMNMMTDDIHYSQFGYNLIGEAIARQITEDRMMSDETRVFTQDPLADPNRKDTRKPPYIAPKEQAVRDNIARWQDLKFGMFIHWGTYSQWGIVESWSLSPEEYKFCMVRPEGMDYFEYMKRYEALKTTFNPVKFNPEKWAEAAEYAGMKYVMFTTKHHDGFNMFDTEYTDYKVTDEDCPFHTNPKADIAKEIFDAFRARGMMAGAYYSIADWHCNDYWWDYFPPKSREINYSASKFPEKWQNLNDFINNQLDELTGGKYGDIDILWFDLCEPSPEMAPQWDRFAGTIRGNNPGAIMVARHQNTIYENYRTPEQRVPEVPLDYPWESCMTMATQWSYKPNDVYKPADQIIKILVQTVSRGGNLLLNVGPGPDGELDPTAYARLKEIGDWMTVNSEGIYGTDPVAPYFEDKLTFTLKDDSVYAFYLNEEDESMPEKIVLKSFEPASSKAVRLMGYDRPLKWKKTDAGIEIDIPASVRQTPPCDYVWGFRIEVK